jgi:hypothetical protein
VPGLRHALHGAGLALAAWQAAALLLGPAPGSHLKAALDVVTLPYRQLLNLDNRWAFFAPDPAAGRLVSVRYFWRDGTERTAQLTRALDWAHPAYLRYSSLLGEVARPDSVAAASAARHLCRLYPEAVGLRFIVERQIAPGAGEVAAGASPLEPRFLETSESGTWRCEGQEPGG